MKLTTVPQNKFIRHKNLPLLFFFTDRRRGDILRAVLALPKNAAVILREYDLDYDDRLALAKQVKQLTVEKSLYFLIGKNLELALKVQADGVHFSDRDSNWQNYLRYKKNLEKDSGKNRQKNFLFTCACHNAESIKRAEKLKLDLVFYSPVFATKSHPDQTPLGIIELTRAARNCKIPLYALGGINSQNIQLLENTGISGIGGIDLFMNPDQPDFWQNFQR